MSFLKVFGVFFFNEKVCPGYGFTFWICRGHTYQNLGKLPPPPRTVFERTEIKFYGYGFGRSGKGYFIDTTNPGGDNLHTADHICRTVQF